MPDARSTARKLLCVIAMATALPADAAKVAILQAEFGLFEATGTGEIMFSPARTVPRRDGQRYGWVIDVQTDQRTLLVREEYLTPARQPVVNLAKDDTLVFPGARRHQVSERRLVPVAGKIYGEWAIGTSEPAGERHLQVVIEGAPEIRFDYRVE